MMLREGCAHCYTAGVPTPHDGPHLVTPTWGGRASCPADEAHDPVLLEELVWVSVEAALEDAGWDLVRNEEIARMIRRARIPTSLAVNGTADLWFIGFELRWEKRTDEHLEESSGTLDVVCTFTAPPTLIAA